MFWQQKLVILIPVLLSIKTNCRWSKIFISKESQLIAKLFVKLRCQRQEFYSVIAITLRYVFALSHNALKLRRKGVACFSYRSGLREIVIASYSYRSSLKGIVIAYYCYRSTRYSFLKLCPEFPPLEWPWQATHACECGIWEILHKCKIESSNIHLAV